MTHVPVALSLLLCEQAVIEARTNNVTLVNCFTELRVEKLPSEPKRFVLFAAMSDGEGDFALEIGISRLDAGGQIYREVRPIQFQQRLQVVRFIYRATQVVFPTVGMYEAALLVEGSPVGHHRFRIVK